MHAARNGPKNPVAAVIAVVAVVAALTGCSASWSHWGDGSRVSMSARADRVGDLESKLVTHRIDAAGDTTVRIRNLAGRVVLEHGDVDDIEIEARVFAKGRNAEHTATLLQSMTWIAGTDDFGRREWTLAYPVDRHQTFHYSLPEALPEASPEGERSGYTVTTKKVYGRKVTVSTERKLGAPTLFADLTITYPTGTGLSVRNVAGAVTAADLSGNLAVDSCVGDVRVASFDGELAIHTASGDVAVGRAEGNANLDTGSGDIDVESITGVARLDTGSGDIHVRVLHAEASFDTGSGDITIDEVSTRRIAADTGSGRVTISSGVADAITVDTGSGRIEVLGVEFGRFDGDTGSGDITIRSSLAGADRIRADTGSGDVTIITGDTASFDLDASLSSGRLRVGFDDAELKRDGRRITGARRGEGRTRIHVDTGSGHCEIRPGG